MSEPASEETGAVRGLAADVHLAWPAAPGGPRRWTLAPDAGVVTIGRAQAVVVRVPGDPLVSRLHATLERIGGQWTILDDGLSVNGTYVNGRRLSGRVRLRDRDAIRVGSTILTFCAPPQTADLQTAAGAGMPSVRRLTEPQRRVLTALCRPYRDDRPYATPASNQQIAEELVLSLDAVKTHLRVLFHKFGIEDLPQNRKRARLAELALHLGLVPR
jgi:pSer/pThr/pTyr-binding forkhead associated (FHA) protein